MGCSIFENSYLPNYTCSYTKISLILFVSSFLHFVSDCAHRFQLKRIKTVVAKFSFDFATPSRVPMVASAKLLGHYRVQFGISFLPSFTNNRLILLNVFIECNRLLLGFSTLSSVVNHTAVLSHLKVAAHRF